MFVSGNQFEVQRFPFKKNPKNHITVAQKPAQMPTQNPAKMTAQLPTQMPTQLPAQLLTQLPAQKPTQMPTQISTLMPAQMPTQLPVQMFHSDWLAPHHLIPNVNFQQSLHSKGSF